MTHADLGLLAAQRNRRRPSMFWRSLTGWATLACLMIALVGCTGGSSGPAAPVPTPPVANAVTPDEVATTYKLGSGDRIKIDRVPPR